MSRRYPKPRDPVLRAIIDGLDHLPNGCIIAALVVAALAIIRLLFFP